MKAKAPLRNIASAIPGDIALQASVLKPIHAPSTVGIMDRVSGQQVLRKTRLRSTETPRSTTVVGKVCKCCFMKAPMETARKIWGWRRNPPVGGFADAIAPKKAQGPQPDGL
ncbi:hypothetical protein D3C85_1084360 [compost metagenome]